MLISGKISQTLVKYSFVVALILMMVMSLTSTSFASQPNQILFQTSGCSTRDCSEITSLPEDCLETNNSAENCPDPNVPSPGGWTPAPGPPDLDDNVVEI